MSKYVKELMMDQLRRELDGTRSVLLLDLGGLDAISETQLRSDLRKKSIRIKVLKNSLAGRIFEEMGLGGLRQYLSGPSVAAWGGDGVAELAKEISSQVKKLAEATKKEQKPRIKGGAVDGVVISPDEVEDITKLPSREELIARVAGLALAPAQRIVSLANAPASGLLGQLRSIAEGAEADAEAAPANAEAAG
ncbi:50S ribosomal protein L10 [Tautonia sociabilis]|uniref:Large ribosomal subunit protein uL10 n=1 Tax=Tautonia sociabilis TaxID=2080755 RepID=A0A432MNJ6_9BACT|nr:50S ribosomal protein L10 [Tautonia sociabilis]RUL88757.1 50S ribosomal protein L10 [Tautonia sociabilis]